MSAQCRILGVDDDPMNISILEDLLEEYEFCTAGTGPEALEKARAHRPDLILLDIMMPGMNGYEVCRQIRQDESLRGVKIILVSAKASIGERLKGYEAGADDYVTKPFDCQELLAKIEVYLRLRSMEEVDQLKSSMLRLLRHEIRTPMTGMISGLEILADACPEDPDQRKAMIDLVLKNVHRFHHLIERVVELSSLEAGERLFEPEITNLSDLVTDAVKGKSDPARERNVTLTVTSEDVFLVDVDRQGMGQVVRDMLDNAIRFSPEGAKVEIQMEETETDVTLAIHDHGKGIEPTSLPCLFTGFCDSDMKHHSHGTGLSLAIAQRIVQQHGGRIEVDSEPDNGTCFRIILPLADSSTESNQSVETMAMSV